MQLLFKQISHHPNHIVCLSSFFNKFSQTMILISLQRFTSTSVQGTENIEVMPFSVFLYEMNEIQMMYIYDIKAMHSIMCEKLGVDCEVYRASVYIWTDSRCRDYSWLKCS